MKFKNFEFDLEWIELIRRKNNRKHCSFRLPLQWLGPSRSERPDPPQSVGPRRNKGGCSGHGAEQRHWLESGEPAARGGRESGLGRHRVPGESNLGVEARRISLARGAPWWRTSDGKEPPAAGRRSGGGRRLRGRGAAMSSGGGCGSEGGLMGWSEWLVGAAALSG
jgi:hypothetical protein